MCQRAADGIVGAGEQQQPTNDIPEDDMLGGAAPVVGDAARLPIADGSVDGIISVEAAFHFSSRRTAAGSTCQQAPAGIVPARHTLRPSRIAKKGDCGV
jgi:Methyltransferase domain